MRNNVELLARRVEADIKRRGLSAGDKYLTGEEVGRLMNVSSVSANRAMQLLAERGLVVRQRKAGTFIGEGVVLPPNVVRKRVHFILTSGIWPDDQTATAYYLNQLLCGVLESMPGVSIQSDVVGPQEINGFVRRVIDSFASTAEVAGVVLVRSSPEVQRQFVEAGVPTVVFGSAFPGVGRLSSVDVDQHQVGRLSAEYLRNSKHRRALTLMLSQWSPGDNAFVAGLMDVLQVAGSEVRMEIQSVPADDDVCDGVVESVLSRAERPTVVVARSPWIARKVDDVARMLALRIPDDVDLILGNHHEVEIDGRRLPGARALESMVECGRKLGRMLLQLSRHEAAEIRQEMVPVEFVDG